MCNHVINAQAREFSGHSIICNYGLPTLISASANRSQDKELQPIKDYH